MGLSSLTCRGNAPGQLPLAVPLILGVQTRRLVVVPNYFLSM